MKENLVQEKSYQFALRIINLYKYLVENKNEYVLSKQILRSGTSIGANIEEARETHYWLRLLSDSDYITKEQSKSLLADAEEILKLLGSIIKTIRYNN